MKICIVGSGNVAHGLGLALNKKGKLVDMVISKTLDHAQALAKKLSCNASNHLADIPKDTELCLLAVPDNQISAIANTLSTLNALVAHTSGSTDIKALQSCKNHGVFYPLQTFDKHHPPDYFPLLLEANTKKNMAKLKALAMLLSDRVYSIDSEKRRDIHLGAVILNNFTNHLFAQIEKYKAKKNIPPNIYSALQALTFEKIKNNKASFSQTGPALRGDQNTIKTHLTLLDQQKELKALYAFFSESIALFAKTTTDA